MSKIVDAVVLAAGTTADPALAGAAPGAHKALIPLNGRPAISYVVENLRRCELVSRVILVSDRETLDSVPGADAFVEADDYDAGTVLSGIRAAGDSERCIVLGGDMALASTEAISDLLTCAVDMDVVYPIVAKPDVEGVFPDRKPFYVRTREGQFTGSTCLLLRPAAALAREELLATLLEARSNPASLLGLVGPGVALKFMFSTLALAEFETQISRAMDLDFGVFISRYPELFMSIDSATDVGLMERELT